MTSSNGNIYRVTVPLCGGSPHKGTVTRTFNVFLSVWTNLFECFMCGHDIFVGPEFVSIYSNYVNCNQRSRDWLIQMFALDFIRQLIPCFIVFTNSQYTLMWKIQQLLFKWIGPHTVYPKKYAHGFCFAVLCCGYTLLFKSNGIFFCCGKIWCLFLRYRLEILCVA